MNEWSDNMAFWDKKEPMVMGDFNSRPSLINYFKDLENKLVLDAGCNTGYMTRQLANRGAIILGVDRELDAIKRAFNNGLFGGRINYVHDSLEKVDLSRFNEGFDYIISDGVMMYNDKELMRDIIGNLTKNLSPDGEIIISVNHPSQYHTTNPSRRDGPNWVKYRYLGDVPEDGGLFQEIYLDRHGTEFISTVRNHYLSTYLDVFQENDLQIKEIIEPIVQKEHLIIPSWGTEYGYPSHMQFVLRKR